MKLSRPFLALAALFVSMQMLSAGDVVGKVTLKGTPPPETPIPLGGPYEATCGKMHEGKKFTTTHWVTGKNGELANVFVYVKDGLTGKTFPISEKKKPVLDQVGCEYVPYMIGAQVNQKIVVKNSDPFMHNVHAIPKTPGNKEVNTAQMGKPLGKDLEFSFPKEEVLLTFKCDVHPWMYAYVGVLDHPFYSITDKDGSFKIENLPPGEYTIEAYHRKAGKQTQKVKVDATGKAEANFALEVPAAAK